MNSKVTINVSKFILLFLDYNFYSKIFLPIFISKFINNEKSFSNWLYCLLWFCNAKLYTLINCNQSICQCIQSPTVIAAGVGHVFVPNIFTPNGDGINDVLIVMPKNIKYVINGVIMDNNNNTIKTIDTMWANGITMDWNGRDANNNKIEGVFKFTCTAIDSNNISTQISSNPCVYDCANTSVNSNGINKNNCDFVDEVNPYTILPIHTTNESCF